MGSSEGDKENRHTDEKSYRTEESACSRRSKIENDDKFASAHRLR